MNSELSMSSGGIPDLDRGMMSHLIEGLVDDGSPLFFEVNTLDGPIRMKMIDITEPEDFGGQTFVLCVDASDENEILADENGRLHLKILEYRDNINLASVTDPQLLADLIEFFEASLLEDTGVDGEIEREDGIDATAVSRPVIDEYGFDEGVGSPIGQPSGVPPTPQVPPVPRYTQPQMQALVYNQAPQWAQGSPLGSVPLQGSPVGVQQAAPVDVNSFLADCDAAFGSLDQLSIKLDSNDPLLHSSASQVANPAAGRQPVQPTQSSPQVTQSSMEIADDDEML